MKLSKRLLSLALSLLLALLCFSALAAADAEPADVYNVIFMIGDGMGINHLRLAEQEGYTLFMEQAAELSGWSRTRSYSSSVTDSAAGATALSCGVRINNKQLCVFPDGVGSPDTVPRIITENAKRHGMRVGIVTTDKTNGATPAGFSVHTDSRDNGEAISGQQLRSDFDLIWGAKTSTVTEAAAVKNGYSYITNVMELRDLTPGARSFGQFPADCWQLTPSKSTPTLAEMTEKAISLLNADAEDGFFLMVEGAHIDKCADDTGEDGQKDYPEKRAATAEAVAAFDNAVKAAVTFSEADGHTLVLVTADHETGKITPDGETGEYAFLSSSHTGRDVPVFVYGAPDLFGQGETMDNRDIPNKLAGRLGWEETFPIEDPVPVQEPEEETTEKPTETPATEPTTKPSGGSSGTGLSFLQMLRAFFQRVIQWFRQLFRMN